MIEVVSFDAAHTLMAVSWQPGKFAFESAIAFGLEVDARAMAAYDVLLSRRWGDYLTINLTRDHDACDRFWTVLTRDWLEELGLDSQAAEPLADFARTRMFDEGGCFSIYPETVSALKSLKGAGYRLAVLSNWDYSLERTLEALGIRELFDAVFPSLEHGVEKPDKRLFRIVEREMGAEPQSILHVGDNPVDDYRGAQEAGWRAALVDRSLTEPARPRIPSLLHVPEAIAWIG